MVFEERYAAKYFVIDSKSLDQREMYEALFDHFCKHSGVIKAIAAKRIQNIDANHWLSQIIQNHIAPHFYHNS